MGFVGFRAGGTAVLCAALGILLVPGPATADTVAQPVPFTQDWSDEDLITADHDWSGVPGITGHSGAGQATADQDPATVTADGTTTPLRVLANPSNLSSNTQGGPAEAVPPINSIALQGDTGVDAPQIVMRVNTQTAEAVIVSYTLRDLDGSNDGVQPVALQYRVGAVGPFVNVPAAYVADATTPGFGPDVPVSVTLPAAAATKPLVQIRVITTNRQANTDEWVGVDEISVTDATPPPTVVIDDGPAPGSTTGRDVTFEFSSPDANAADFECTLDGTPADCDSPESYEDLGGGAHTFSVRAVDAEGNEGPAATRNWTVDAAPPVLTLGFGQTDLTCQMSDALDDWACTGARSATFTIAANEPLAGGSPECRLQGQPAFGDCSGGQLVVPDAEGEYTIEARATDAHGNAGDVATLTSTADYTGPTVTIDGGPTGATSDPTPEFTFSSPDADVAGYLCRVDALGSWSTGTCASPRTTPALSPGEHTFKVVARDTNGNLGNVAAQSFTVLHRTCFDGIDGDADGDTDLADTDCDDGGPEPAISDIPGCDDDADNDADGFFDLSDPDCEAGVGLGEYFPSCADAGDNDADGSVDLADPDCADGGPEVNDPAPPETTIKSGPKRTTTSRKARFFFTSVSLDTDRFACRLDGKRWRPCNSPKSYRRLARGRHFFEVRAVDLGGVADTTPPLYRWRILKKS